MFSEYRGIPREAQLLVYLSFIPNVAIGLIYTDLSYFLPKFQGLDPTLTGITISAMGLTVLVESIPLGVLADRYGRRKMLIIGNVCASLSLIGFALTTNFLLYLVISVLEGTGEAAFAVSVGALIAEKAGDQKRTSAFSLLAFLGWIAGALGASVISAVSPLQNFGIDIREGHILLYVVVGLLSLAITPLILKISESTKYGNGTGVLPRKSWKVLTKFLVYSVTIALGAGLFVPIMVYWYGQAYGVPDTISGPVLGVTNLLTAGVVFMSPALATRLGLVRATVITQASSTIFMVLIPSSPTFAIAAGLYLVRVFLMNLSNPLTQSLIMGLVSPDERGKASGLAASFWRLPNSVSVVIGLTLIGGGALALPFYLATVLYVVGISLFWLLFRDARLPEEVKPGQRAVQSSSVDGPATAL